MTVQSKALVIHQCQQQCAALVHDILPSSAGYVLGAGKVLTRSEQDAVVAALTAKRPAGREFLPTTLLAFDADSLLWYRPAGEATMGFVAGSRKVCLPALVLWLNKGNLRVAALKSGQRPGPESRLYHSGLPNVDDLGHWCSGGNRLPDEPAWSDAARAERVFLESPFTHAGGSGLKNCENIMAFWHHWRRRQPFPVSRLIPMDVSLADWAGDK